jgi:hypothetical protein
LRHTRVITREYTLQNNVDGHLELLVLKRGSDTALRIRQEEIVRALPESEITRIQ